MNVKVYVVEEVQGNGWRIIAVKLTHEAARAIAKEKGDRRVTRWVADKICN